MSGRPFLPLRYVDYVAIRHPVAAGARVGLVPNQPSRFRLAKAATEILKHDPTIEGLLFEKRVVTFGATARESYERMIKVSAASA